MTSTLQILLFASGVLTLAGAACGQPEQTGQTKTQSKPPKLDLLASKTLKKWDTLRYHLEGAGIKTIGFDITVTSKGGMTGTWKATGRYSFKANPKKPYGTVTWDGEEVSSAMQRRGWTAAAFAKDVRKDSTVMSLANATVTSHPSRGRTILIVKGGKTKDEQALLFDSAGVMVGEIVGPMKKRMDYQIVKDKYLRVGESYQMPDTKAKLKITHATIAGHLLPTGLTEVVRIRKQLLSDLTMVFSGFSVNGKKLAVSPSPGQGKTGGKKVPETRGKK